MVSSDLDDKMNCTIGITNKSPKEFLYEQKTQSKEERWDHTSKFRLLKSHH